MNGLWLPDLPCTVTSMAKRFSRRRRVVLLWLCAAAMPCCMTLQAQQAPANNTPVIVQPGAPGQPSRVLPPDTRATVPPVAAADVEFMQGMIMHHSQAVVMTAMIPTHTTNVALRELGAKIASSQSDEMQLMKRWLIARGQPISMAMPGMPDMDMHGQPMALMPGMLSPAQMQALGAAHGAAFDRLFLTGMIQHHNGALIMVHDLFNAPGAGQDADLFNFATDADNTQRAEIRIMQSMLAQEFPNTPKTPKESQ